MKFNDGWQISLLSYNFYKRNFNDIWEVFEWSTLVNSQIKFVILFTANHTILIVLVQRIYYWIY